MGSAVARSVLFVALSACGGQAGFASGFPDAGVDGALRHPESGIIGTVGSDAGTPVPAGGDSGVTGSGSGSGAVDVGHPCDLTVALDGDAPSFAKALGLCTAAASAGYGLVSASYSGAFGSTQPPHDGQWGMLTAFGKVVRPREGAMLGVLSSGYARQYDDAMGVVLESMGPGPGLASDFSNSSPDGALDGTMVPTGKAPPGFPKHATGCVQSKLVNDMIDLKLVLKAPADAHGFSFDFDFYSSDWPNFVCSATNDAFVAYLTSSKLTGNIAFDESQAPISVNASYFDHCSTNTPVGCLSAPDGGTGSPTGMAVCEEGPAELADTGFGDLFETQCTGGNRTATLGGATGWLTTVAPIEPGERFTLELMIWDAGDGLRDSSVLLDDFQWIGTAPKAPSTDVAAPK